MKKNLTALVFTFMIGSANAQKQKTQVFQLMEPGFNTKTIEGTISEVYNTQRFGKTLWWMKIGNDTLIHVWDRHLDTATMKVGNKKKFLSIKRLESNWWMKEKSEIQIKTPDHQNILTIQ